MSRARLGALLGSFVVLAVFFAVRCPKPGEGVTPPKTAERYIHDHLLTQAKVAVRESRIGALATPFFITITV